MSTPAETVTLRAQFNTLSTDFSDFKAEVRRDIGSISSKLDSVATTMTVLNARGGTFDLKSLGLVMTIGAVIWAAIRVQFQADLQAVVAEQAISRTERSENKQEISKVSNGLADVKSQTSAQGSLLTEIETQFRAVENYQSLQRADQLRTNGLLWQKAYGEPYPDAAFYPSIARPK